ncbi:MAG: ABC transporter ATP-binding protein [Chromatocurvus sp.]
MINVQSVTRRFGAHTAVDNVSFRVGEREIVGLLGHNGAGKSTVMRMLSGYLEPSAGRLTVNGFDLDTEAPAMQRQLGYLPEHLPIYPDMMIAEYLDYAAALKRIPRATRPASIRRVLDLTDLGARRLDRIDTLSRGLRQRVGVAQALLGEPRLLILDEPTNGLDPGQTAQMRTLIRELAREATVILSTHIMQEVEAVCERVLVLHNGHRVLDQRLAELKESQTLRVRAGGDAVAMRRTLMQLPQVLSADIEDTQRDVTSLRLELHPGTERDRAAGNISHALVGTGARLLELRPLLRDLDSVLQELAAGGPARG